MREIDYNKDTDTIEVGRTAPFIRQTRLFANPEADPAKAAKGLRLSRELCIMSKKLSNWQPAVGFRYPVDPLPEENFRGMLRHLGYTIRDTDLGHVVR